MKCPQCGFDSTTMLSTRVVESIQLLCGGMSNREIGDKLGIKARTVKMHLAKAMRFYGVNNRVRLVGSFLNKEDKGEPQS